MHEACSRLRQTETFWMRDDDDDDDNADDFAVPRKLV